MRRAAGDLLAPSPVSLAELRSRKQGSANKVADYKAELVEASYAAEMGEEGAAARRDQILADLAYSENALQQVTEAEAAAVRRQDAAQIAAKEEARDILALGREAEVQALTDGMQALLFDAEAVAARLDAVLPTVQAFVNKAGLPFALVENLSDRMRGSIAFAFGGFLAVPRGETKPLSPADRFAADARADLARAGLAPPSSSKENPDNG